MHEKGIEKKETEKIEKKGEEKGKWCPVLNMAPFQWETRSKLVTKNPKLRELRVAQNRQKKGLIHALVPFLVWMIQFGRMGGKTNTKLQSKISPE